MADYIVSQVLLKLANFLAEEAGSLMEVGDSIRSPRDRLQWIHSFLRDADHQRREEQNETIRVWVAQIRDVAYDLEDVIDEYHLKMERRRRRRAGLMYFCVSLIAFVTQIATWSDLGLRIKKINKKLDEISANKSMFSFSRTVSSLASSAKGLTRRYELEDDVVGLEEEASTLTQLLIDQGVTRRAVISIVGMGGLGKTTLANKVYDSQKIKTHFSCRAWIFVSQTYRAEDLLKSLLKEVTGLATEEMASMDEQDMKRHLRAHLRLKRYLVAIDDIWDIAAWNIIRAALPDGGMGSRVLLTTRIVGVARSADPDCPPFVLKLLTPEASWDLFRRRAFPGARCPLHLQQLREIIIAICGGLPLAITVLGGILRTREESYHEWKQVLEQICDEFRQGYDQTHKILALSYDVLPHHLKACFLYFAAYPEDRNIDAEKLMNLWIAEGFIQPKQSRTMEDLAADYLKELIQRSMILLAARNDFVGVAMVRIHDLFLDLARSEAREVNFLHVHDSTNIPFPPTLRRLSLHGSINEFLSPACSTPKLRSLLCIQETWILLSKEIMFPRLKLLRVIDLEHVRLERLPQEIGSIIQLRYLGLRDTWLKELPSSIGNLPNLQTIDIRDTEIKKVTDAFWKIQTLRHILVDPQSFVVSPKISCSLNDLRTLLRVTSGDWVRNGGLQKMRNLRRLELQGIKDSEEKALLDAVEKLDCLVKIRFFGTSLPRVTAFANHHHLRELALHGSLGLRGSCLAPKSCQLLPNLTALQLRSAQLVQEDIALLASLRSLEYLELLPGAYAERVMTCPSGGFPRLIFLKFFSLSSFEEWILEGGAMPRLAELHIWYCENLKMLPGGLQRITSLQKLNLWNMPNIKNRIQKDLGEDYPKIKHVPSITALEVGASQPPVYLIWTGVFKVGGCDGSPCSRDSLSIA